MSEPKLKPRKYPKQDSASWADTLFGKNFRTEQQYPKPSYINHISDEEADALGYYPDEYGHRDDRVKLINHPSHPSRGTFISNYQYDLSDFGMEDPNLTIFGLADGNDPQAIVTYKGSTVIPEITVTPTENYYMNTYDNIKLIPRKRYIK